MTVRILTGDCRARMAELPEKSIQCCVTSPPYYGLRNYNVDGQIGLEPTLADYLTTMVDVFREVRRVLRDDGTLWLNIGDSYATKPNQNAYHGRNGTLDTSGLNGNGSQRQSQNRIPSKYAKIPEGMKAKDLMMVPARLAIALQADGWYLRSDIIWSKPNPMPESVIDRPTSAHEHVFLLTKQARYFYDSDAVRTPITSVTTKMPDGWNTGPGAHGSFHPNGREKGAKSDKQRGHSRRHDGFNDRWESMSKDEQQANGANLRNVWTIATHAFPLAHFATFPPALVEPCIKAGTSEKGACSTCGAPWVRMVEAMPDTRTPYKTQGMGEYANGAGRNDGKGSQKVLRDDGRGGDLATKQRTTTGWQPTCSCDADVVPCVVLDPFGGSGTTGVVADRLGRDAVLIELNPEYAEMGHDRIKGECPMFAEVAVS